MFNFVTRQGIQIKYNTPLLWKPKKYRAVSCKFNVIFQIKKKKIITLF